LEQSGPKAEWIRKWKGWVRGGVGGYPKRVGGYEQKAYLTCLQTFPVVSLCDIFKNWAHFPKWRGLLAEHMPLLAEHRVSLTDCRVLSEEYRTL